jgi:serine/threonine protein kinase
MCSVVALLLGKGTKEEERDADDLNWSASCADFLSKGLTPDPDQRLSSQEALLHPWLFSVSQ